MTKNTSIKKLARQNASLLQRQDIISESTKPLLQHALDQHQLFRVDGPNRTLQSPSGGGGAQKGVDSLDPALGMHSTNQLRVNVPRMTVDSIENGNDHNNK